MGGFAWGAMWLKRYLIAQLTDDQRGEIYVKAMGIRSAKKRDAFLNDRLGKDHGYYEDKAEYDREQRKERWEQRREERRQWLEEKRASEPPPLPRRRRRE
jgi:hypothetical protein